MRVYYSGFVCLLSLLFLSFPAAAQKAAPPKTQKPIIFAVTDGTEVEPIAYVSKGKLEAPVNGSDEAGIITAFAKSYYKVGTAYRLVFGGGDAGTVTIKSSNPKSDCGKNMATVATKSTKVAIKGLIMGLATNATARSKSSGLRRKPTQAERDEIEALVRTEYIKNKLTPKPPLRYQNLTAIDVDGDGKVEFVGSYWVEVDRLTRALLFFIADKRANGKYAIGYSEYQLVDQESTMSKSIKDVDDGIYHELLIDYFDVDGDGTAEIFTKVSGFEGAQFNAYKRTGTKWVRSYANSNYHCAY